MDSAEVTKKLEKLMGQAVVQRLDATPKKVEVISTGLISLDSALGVGGLPKGRIVELYGAEAGGKSTLMLQTVAEAHKLGYKTLYVDAEHSFDESYAKNIGVDSSKLLLSQPDYGEQALQIVEAYAQSDDVALIVIDSVAALVPKAEVDGEMEDQFPGLQARMMGKALRKLAPVVAKSNTIVVFINQLRSKLGVFYGSPDVTPGGNALKFYASVRLDIRRIGDIKDGEEKIGIRSRIKVVKNKVAPPFKSTEVDLIFGQGFSPLIDLVDFAVSRGVIEQAGAWYNYAGERFKGKAALTKAIMDVEKLRDKLTSELR